MESKYLVILEVSQKQAYIFSSNKLRKNIEASAVIAHVTSPYFFKELSGVQYSEHNLVYSGGGHTVLIFDEENSAKCFIKAVTKAAMEKYPGLELFGTYLETEDEPTSKDLLKLSQKLEKKKSLRKASFHQGSFGIEKVNTENNSIEPLMINGKKLERSIPDEEEKTDQELSPDGFQRAFEFEKMSAKNGDNNFLAVVHIDGNAMGKRTVQITDKLGTEWASLKTSLDEFSRSIDMDFKNSYKEMCEVVADKISPDGELVNLQLQKDDSSGKFYFPIRRIITAGDDICFVTEGHLGLECARIFIEKLSKKENAVDHKGYAACAGVAIVHRKYPFYKAYELAELLCSNAKKYISTTAGPDAAAQNSAIDWHIEFGELQDTLDEIRSNYKADDGSRMELRPYIICGDGSVTDKDNARDYYKFKKLICIIQNGKIGYASGKIKGLRNAIKQGENTTLAYLGQNLMNDLLLEGYQDIYTEAKLEGVGIGKGLERKATIQTSDGIKRSLFFDAIEMLDTFISIDSPEA